MTSIAWKPKREKTYSRHHLLPQNPFGTRLKWSNDPINLIWIEDNTHRAIHHLFRNQMLAEQLITMVNVSETALKPEIKQWLLDTLTSKDIHDPTIRYKDECIK